MGMGCYPTELYKDAFKSSIKECSNQIPACAGDKCFVKKFDNKCGTTGAQTPLVPGSPPPPPSSPEMEPLKDPRDICSELQEHCSKQWECNHFKNDEAKAQCKKGPEIPANSAVNCFNGCKIEQRSGTCRKDVKPKDSEGRCKNPLNGQYYDG
jgi:hypothetical protein